MKLPAPQGVHSTVYITGQKSERGDRGSYTRTFPPVGGHHENWKGRRFDSTVWKAELWVTLHNRELKSEQHAFDANIQFESIQYELYANIGVCIDRRCINGTRSVIIHKTIFYKKYDGKRISRLPATRKVCFQRWFKTLCRQVHSS